MTFRRRHPNPSLLALIALGAASGCASDRQPDLAVLYRDAEPRSEPRTPLVGIHGLMGSEIVDPQSGEVLWGQLAELLQGAADMRLALPIDPGARTVLRPTSSIKTLGVVEVYAGIVETLTQIGGYRVATGAGPRSPPSFFPFAYDWRLSCAENAARLADLITEIKRLYGDPHLQVDIVAHSLGGLIARYYILHGGRDVREARDLTPTYAGAANVRRLVMLGTPNAGAAGALLALVDGYRVGLARIHPDLVATMPSMVELMPSPSLQVLFTPDGAPAPLDIHDPSTWERERWGIFDPALEAGILRRSRSLHEGWTDREAALYLRGLRAHFRDLLRRAAAFHRALEAGPIPASVRTLLLGGDCTPTLQALVVERREGRWIVRPRPADVERPIAGVDLDRIFHGPGDGDVTRASLVGALPRSERCAAGTCLPDAVASFQCDRHRDLVKSATFRDDLLHFLLFP